MEDDRSWGYRHSPLDIVEPLLSGVIEANRDHGRTISLGRHFLNYDYARPLRSQVVERVLALLSHSDAAVAVRAARLVDDMVRMPMGLGSQSPSGELRSRYDAEFADTLERLHGLVASGGLAPAAVITIVQGIEWHARFNEGLLAEAARAVLGAVPTTLDFRLRASMVDGAQRAFRGQLDYEEWSTENLWLHDLVGELKREGNSPVACSSGSGRP
jgi:hypothetical protein